MSIKEIILLLFFQCVVVAGTGAQIRLAGYYRKDINADLYNKRWSARWISVPGEADHTYGVYHFRKKLNLETVPERYIVHVTADNRYKLYVNGNEVSEGPEKGDVNNWNFETVDLGPYLEKGENVLSAVVWNYGVYRPVSINSLRTGFLLQGNTEKEEAVNTNRTWRCMKDSSYSAYETPVFGYYAAGPGESVEGKKYPWGWKEKNYDDRNWKEGKELMEGNMKSGPGNYGGWLLIPRSLPSMERKEETPMKLRMCEGISGIEKGYTKEGIIEIPSNREIHIVLDQGYLTTGYLKMCYEGGEGSEIKIGYAESYYDDTYSGNKGNRNEIKGKIFYGYSDRIEVGGEKEGEWEPLWWRTWRYLDIRIKTGGESLKIKSIKGIYTAYPFHLASSFHAKDSSDLEKMLTIGWRTARLCAHESYMDCPYYEQLQYFGDTRIQTMVTMYNTQDSLMVQQALEQGRRSMVADGLTRSCYPGSSDQVIPSYSLMWIGMGYDYWMYRGGEKYLSSLLPAYQSILSWYALYLKEDKCLGRLPYWDFVDWAEGFENGEPPRGKDGRSAIDDLLYIIALDEASAMERSLGLKYMAEHYETISGEMKRAFSEKYWDEERELFSDTDLHDSYSQHTNTLAVLAGIVRGDSAREVMEKVLKEKDLIQSTIYFRYYVDEAMKESGLGDELLKNLGVWENQMKLGLTTWAERPEPSRSDCHAWGASLNVEFYRTILGIDTDGPGFSKVKICPCLGPLREVSGKVPHPEGEMWVSYKIEKGGGLRAEISLPETVNGKFVWNGKEYPLKGGFQRFNIK